MKAFSMLMTICMVLFALTSVVTASDDASRQIADLEAKKQTVLEKLNEANQGISSTQLWLDAAKKAEGMPKAARDYMIKQYLIMVEGVKEENVDIVMFGYDSHKVINSLERKLQRAETARDKINQWLDAADKRIAQLQATQRYLKDPVGGDLEDERRHLENLRKALERPLDEEDRKSILWQIENTIRRIRELEAAKGEQQRPPTLPPQQQQGTGPLGTTSGSYKEFQNPTIGGARVDRCLYWASQCDKPAADRFCRDQGLLDAETWNWAYMAPTRVQGDGKVCKDPKGCGGFTYIKCRVR